MNIGKIIKEKRTASGLTQKELADLVNVDQSFICQIERGTKTPTLPLGKELAKVFKCTIDELVN